MIKRRIAPFLILEVLIAFLLISMTILPFSSYPYRAFAKEINYLEQMEIEPYFTTAFIESLEQFDRTDFDLPCQMIPFGQSETLNLKRHVKIKKIHEASKRGTLLAVEVTIQGKNAKVTRSRNFYIPTLETHDEI